MRKRSECTCGCHSGLGMIHFAACCEPDQAKPEPELALPEPVLSDLLNRYFELGVAEGKEGRKHDTLDGDAQATRSAIEALIASERAKAEAAEFRLKTYQEVDADLNAQFLKIADARLKEAEAVIAPFAPSSGSKAKWADFSIVIDTITIRDLIAAAKWMEGK